MIPIELAAGFAILAVCAVIWTVTGHDISFGIFGGASAVRILTRRFEGNPSQPQYWRGRVFKGAIDHTEQFGEYIDVYHADSEACQRVKTDNIRCANLAAAMAGDSAAEWEEMDADRDPITAEALRRQQNAEAALRIASTELATAQAEAQRLSKSSRAQILEDVRLMKSLSKDIGGTTVVGGGGRGSSWTNLIPGGGSSSD